MPDESEIQGPRWVLDDWLDADWKQVEYARMGGTEVWLFMEEEVTGCPRLAWVAKQRVNQVFYLYARMRDALALVRSETNYKDVRLTHEQFVQGIEGDFTMPYAMRSEAAQRDPPKEEGVCRQNPKEDHPTEDSQEPGAS